MTRPPVDDALRQSQAIFLGRLQRLIHLRRDLPGISTVGIAMLDRCIDATYRDCIDYGCADAARPIMSAHRKHFWRELR